MANSSKRPGNHSNSSSSFHAAEPHPDSIAFNSRRNPLHSLPKSADDVLAVFDTMSRRIDDLARELNCLGYFPSDDDDRPRAA